MQHWTPRKLEVEEVSPWANLRHNITQAKNEQIKSKYLEPNLIEALRKSKLFNEYYGKDMDSKIGLRGAQTNESGARTGLIGEQTNAAHMKNEYLPQQLKAQMAQSIMQQKLFQQMMGGEQEEQNTGGHDQQSNNFRQPQEAPQEDIQQHQGALAQPNPSVPQEAQQEEVQEASPRENSPPKNKFKTLAQAALAMKYMKMGEPKYENINGKYVALTPFGNYEVAVGQTPLEKELTKVKAKRIEGLENIALSGDQKLVTLNHMADIVSSPQFEAMRQNPIAGKHELAWYAKMGTPEQQALVGSFMSDSGRIIADFASDFKGSFRSGEQNLLKETKPNDSDSLEMMKGKTEALLFLTQALTDRSKYEAELMREKGMSFSQASREADKMFNQKGLKDEVHDMLKTKGGPTAEGAAAALAKRRSKK